MVEKRSPGDQYLHELSWEEKARQNPLYGVMSVDAFIDAKSAPTPDQLERFFNEGEVKVRKWLVPWLEATDTDRQASILEFGCGMGRLLRTLRGSYPNVSGIDVSPTMVERAATYVPGPTFRAISEDGGLPFAPNTFDRIYSYAVFQHINRWSVIRKAIAEIARVLKPGGLIKLQFDMAFPLEFVRHGGLPRRAYALEKRSILYGWTRRFGLPIPGFKLLSHSHWSGVRPGYGQLVEVLYRNGLRVHGIEYFLDAPHLVWFMAHKHQGNGSMTTS